MPFVKKIKFPIYWTGGVEPPLGFFFLKIIKAATNTTIATIIQITAVSIVLIFLKN